MDILKKYFTVLLLSLLLPVLAMADQVTVAAAANLQYTLEDLKAQFTKETGINVKDVIGSSGNLTSQIENGAPFDVFLSADMKYPQAVYKDGFSLRPPKVYAYGVLVLWTMKDMDLSKGVKVLSGPDVKKIALADPQLAPYGRQSVNVMKFYHLYPFISSKLVYGQNISQTNQFIATGAADIGFTAKSVVLAPDMKDKGKWGELPPQAYKPIAQGAVVLKYGQKHHAIEARAFYDFLFSPSARKIFKKYGYDLP